ncbi:pilus assembly protein PilZ [Oceaniglobus ichthyenteri]|uniref:pilus assembly protein PilZ n=1 Tax=Oceaniglobus ichthyenteri TaxID=2136177 RepID=UPI000D38A99B|nr:pilus assembly protein PilZ [Oceaniglobus ichthyenteri]
MKHADLQPPDSAVALPAGFAHKGEHPQLEVPFTALIGTQMLTGRSLSLTSAVVSGAMPTGVDGTVVAMALRLNFSGFAVLLYVDAWVENGNEDDTYTLHFTEPTGEHLAPLRYVLNSYIAGDIVSLGGFMGYTGPLSVKEKAAAQTPGLSHKIQNVVRRGIVIALTAGLALIALNLAHERVVFSYEARPVTVTAPGQTLMATAAGQLTYADPNAAKGEVVYSILANSGDYLSVKMPCDCTILPMRNFVEGATIMTGTPIVRLASGDAGLVANTEISAEGAVKLVSGQQAELVLANGTVVPVTPEILPSPDDGDRTVRVEMTLDDTTNVAPGQVARLRFRRNLLPSFLH